MKVKINLIELSEIILQIEDGLGGCYDAHPIRLDQWAGRDMLSERERQMLGEITEAEISDDRPQLREVYARLHGLRKDMIRLHAPALPDSVLDNYPVEVLGEIYGLIRQAESKQLNDWSKKNIEKINEEASV